MRRQSDGEVEASALYVVPIAEDGGRAVTRRMYDITIIPTENLALLGIPLSVFTLVKNLLDCHEGDFVGDEAYKSFEDVRADLQLMLDDPSRFLDNIRPTSHPSFCIGDKLYGRDDDVADVKEA
eukprot:scaffold4089_cov114-Alexandrium_tamarense.AAC.2